MKNRHWIQGGFCCESPLFRREFWAEGVKSARLEICGLGFFRLYVNGKRVGDEEFLPAWTNFSSLLGCRAAYPVWEERANYRTHYLVYDLTPYLREGENVLGVQLGNGFYHQTRRRAEGEFIYGFPKLRYELTLTHRDGTEIFLESGPDTLWAESEILENNLYFGETHDLRKLRPHWAEPGPRGEGWQKSNPCHAPETELVEQTCPADRVVREISPVFCGEKDGVKIYDCGENITGWVNVRCRGRAGEAVTVRHSEELSPEGDLDFDSCGGKEQIQEDRYFCGEEPLTAHPKFCWHGFRYFAVQGPGESVSVSVVHTDLAVTSGFRCANPALNWLYEAYVRSQLGNIHGCVPSDCPHRERLGYTGDGQITARCVMLTLDAKKMYDKWMEDILDSQGAETGHIPHTAPFYGGGGGPGGWGGAIFQVPMAYYEAYGDVSLLRRAYPAILRWLDYMDAHSDSGLVVREEEGGWCLGDWCPPPGMEHPKIPPEFVNTYYYIKGLGAAIQAAALLGEPEPPKAAMRLENSEKAFVNAFYDPDAGSFCGGENGADAFALDLGLGDGRTRRNLAERYRKSGRLDTGIFGTDILLDVLFRQGEGELAYELMTRKTEASFANMMEQGATTLWETWDGGASHNHPMFGGAVRQLFTQVLGIRQQPGTAGYADYRIEPADIPGLSWAEGWITAPGGQIYVRWKRNADGSISIFEQPE